MTKLASVWVAMVAAGAMLTGCTPGVTGGDTKCKDFTASDEAAQNEAVAAMLKQEKGADAAQLEITGTRLAVQTYCQTIATPDSPIKERPHL